LGSVTVEPLGAGAHELRLRVEGPGGIAIVSERNVAIVVPERGQGTGGGPLVALLPAEGAGAAALLQVPGGGTGAGRVSIDAIDYADSGGVIVAGRGAPGSSMRLYADNRPVGTAQVGEDGRRLHDQVEARVEPHHHRQRARARQRPPSARRRAWARA
jgi:hypothetical protein